MPFAPICCKSLKEIGILCFQIMFIFLQDDTYSESYISTIGVDFVSCITIVLC